MKLRLILGDQLSPSMSSLSDASKDDVILMSEVRQEATYVKHHKKKIVFLFSAMRHFAQDLTKQGFNVHYVPYDDPENSGSLRGEVTRIAQLHDICEVIVTSPGEYRVQEDMKDWSDALGIPVRILPDDRFLCGTDEFAAWAEGRKQLRMEYFYREMRKKTGLLMNGEEPEGGKWNYDKENRGPPKDGLRFPDRPDWSVDSITLHVLKLVEKRFDSHFGDLKPFEYPVTRKQATHYLNWFIENALEDFGTHQDAMVQNEALMYHSHLSALINVGLLGALECCEAAENAYQEGNAPLNAVEGFIRQIIGWREFIRGIYWMKMPDYATSNVFNAKRDLPEWFWSGNTRMNCLNQAICETKQNAYAHHIQRLMVIGNFSLLAGLDPKQVQEWFLLVYHDAYEWVEMPNVVGMGLYADGGVFASKPYASSGSYINKMSDYCGHCSYSVTKKNGPKACPYNYLYWNFLVENRKLLSKNQRMGMMYGSLDRMSDEKKDAIRDDSKRFLKALEEA